MTLRDIRSKWLLVLLVGISLAGLASTVQSTPALAQGEPGGRTETKQTQTTVSYSGSDKGPGFRLESVRGDFVEFRLRDLPRRAPQRTSSTARYDWRDEATLDYVEQGTGVKERLVLKSRPPISSFTFDAAWTNDLTVTERDGDWFLSRDDTVLFAIRAPWIRDAAGVAGRIDLTISDGKATVGIDPAFLDHAAYPVTLDPISESVECSGCDFSSVATMDFPQTDAAVATYEDSAVILHICAGGSVCPNVYRYEDDAWQLKHSADDVIQSNAHPKVITLSNETTAYAAGLLGSNVAVWRGTRPTNSDPFTWGTATVVAPAAANTNLAIWAGPRPGGSGVRVSVWFNEYLGSKRLAFTDDDGANWMVKPGGTTDSTTDHRFERSTEITGSPAPYGVFLEENPLSGADRRVRVSNLDSVNGFGQGTVIKRDTDVAEVPQVGRAGTDLHVVFPQLMNNKYALRYCRIPVDLSDTCDDSVLSTLHSDIKLRSWAMSVDRGRVVVTYIPVFGTNADTLVRKVFYEGAWSPEHVVSILTGSQTAYSAAAAPAHHTGNETLVAWRRTEPNVVSLVADVIDLPAYIDQPTATRPRISTITGCSQTTLTTAPFEEPVTKTLSIKQGATTVRTYPSVTDAAAVSQTWDGKLSDGITWAGTEGEEVGYSAVIEAVDSFPYSVDEIVPLVVDRRSPTGSLNLSHAVISPNSDGVKESSLVSSAFSEPSTYTLDIISSSGHIVRSISETTWPQETLEFSWDGRNQSGSVVPEGTYTVRLQLSDPACNPSGAITSTLKVDLTPPAISGLAASRTVISPNSDGIADDTTYTASVSDVNPDTWQVTVDGTALTGSGSQVSATWGPAGGTDGSYTAHLVAIDAGGNQSTLSAFPDVSIDLTAPSVDSYSTDTPAFSPNGDGVKESATLAGSVSDLHGPVSFDLVIRDHDSTTVRTSTGTAPPGPGSLHSWDGTTDSAMTVPDGRYGIFTVFTDSVGNSSAPSALEVIVDRVLPTLTRPFPAVNGTTTAHSVELSVSGQDFLAGLDLSSFSFVVDDAPVPGQDVNHSGNTHAGVGLTTLDLGTGLHNASAAVTDIAGNRSEPFEWRFVVGNLSTKQAALVTAAAGEGTAPSLPLPGEPVTVDSVSIDVSVGTLLLSDAEHAGHGILCGSFSPSAIRARFESITGDPLFALAESSSVRTNVCSTIAVLDPDLTRSHVLHVAGDRYDLGSVRFPIPTGTRPNSPVTVEIATPSPVTWSPLCQLANASADLNQTVLRTICDPTPNYLPVDVGTEVSKHLIGQDSANGADGFARASSLIDLSLWRVESGVREQVGSTPDLRLARSQALLTPLWPTSPYDAISSEGTEVLVRTVDSWANASHSRTESSFHWSNPTSSAEGYSYLATTVGQGRSVLSSAFRLYDSTGESVAGMVDDTNQPVVVTDQTGAYGRLAGFRNSFTKAETSRQVTWGWVQVTSDRGQCGHCEVSSQWLGSQSPLSFTENPDRSGFSTTQTANPDIKDPGMLCISCVLPQVDTVPEKVDAWFLRHNLAQTRTNAHIRCAGAVESWPNGGCNAPYSFGYTAPSGDEAAGVMNILWVGAPCPGNSSTGGVSQYAGLSGPGDPGCTDTLTWGELIDVGRDWIAGYRDNPDHRGKARLVLATNNGNEDFTDVNANRTHAEHYYYALNEMKEHASDTRDPEGARVYISGGMDSEEVGSEGWRSAHSTLPWYASYNQTADELFPSQAEDVPSNSKLNLYMLGAYGSLPDFDDNNPTQTGDANWGGTNAATNEQARNSHHGWSGYDVWRASWGKGESDYNENYALPQVYVHAQPKEWQQLNQTAEAKGKGAIAFSGVIATCNATGGDGFTSSEDAYNSFRDRNPSPLYYRTLYHNQQNRCEFSGFQ